MYVAHAAEGPISSTGIDIQRLQKEAENLRGEELIRYASDIFGPRLALLSSFGTESALLLHMVSQVKKDMLVLFVDTQKLFAQTHEYKDRLVKQLGLTNVQSIFPDPVEVEAKDKFGILYHTVAAEIGGSRPCCDLRKVRPLERQLQGKSLFKQLEGPLAEILGDNVAIINGIKRHHGFGRADAPKVISVGNRTDFSPLADFSREEIAAEFEKRGLPTHPLSSIYTSISCNTDICTPLPEHPDDFRAGRDYCGIDLSDRRVRASYDSSNL